jgi:hypothetical protein
MKPPASFAALGREFDNFLFAAIGEDRNGMPLSVVSALARMDLDPWQEAASLAAVSVETATGQLTSLLAALPDSSLKRLDPSTTAARLIALLPQRPGSNTGVPVPTDDVVVATRRSHRMNVILIVFYVTLMLGTQFVLTHEPPRAHADTANGSASPADASHTPPPAGSARPRT